MADQHKQAKADTALLAFQRELSQRIRPFAITYLVVSLPRILKLAAKKGSLAHRLELLLRTLLKPSSTILKLSAFPAILPFVYQKLLPLVKRYSNDGGDDDKYDKEITALLASPVTLLLPHGLRVYLALYAITSAMTTFFKSASPKDQARKIEEGRAGEKEWRDYLPRVTLLNAIGNSWMVWSWFHEKGVFPKSYEKLILDHSPHYCPHDRPPFETRDFLETTLNPPITSGGHQWQVCQTLHPGEPSCLKNHLKAWLDGIPQIAKWVAGFGALSTLIGFKKRIASEPVAAVREWLDYTIRGILYVNGSIQTVWGVTCILQRLFPGNFMPKNRWIINGSLASLWVYALPRKRQTEISVYVGRISALSLWRAYLKHGGVYLPHGEVLLFAAGWASLLQLREGSWKIEGLMRRAITFIEGNEKELERTAATWTPPVSRAPSTGDIRRAIERGELGVEVQGRMPQGVHAATNRRFESIASTMSAVTDSGFASEEEDIARGEITIESRLELATIQEQPGN